MSKVYALGLFLVSLGCVLSFQNCGNKHANNLTINPQGDVGQSVNLTGKIQNLNIAGCSKVVVSDADGKSQFIPIGADTSALPEGTSVHLVGTVAEDMVSSCMSGVLVNVSTLKAVSK